VIRDFVGPEEKSLQKGLLMAKCDIVTRIKPNVDEEFMPSPAQIKVGCERIRQNWDHVTLSRRNAYQTKKWSVPSCRVAKEF